MNFASLNDLRKKEEEEGKRNEYYSGGNDNRGGGSGLNVVAPDSSSDPLQRIVNSAAANSASGMMPDASEGAKRKITLYKNGFTVDDGPLRDLESPENKKFLQALVAGFIPAELQADVPRRADGQPAEVFIGLEDRRGEEYRAPTPPPYVAYSGEGASIGSAAPTHILSPAVFATDAPPAVDDSLPSTMLQIKLHNGKKLKLNDGVPSQNFTLSAGFPPKEISDVNATLADAGLVGAAITLKLV